MKRISFRRISFAAAAAMLALTTTACSFSDSSKSISKSISSPSVSLSNSSSPKKKYIAEVQDFTAAFIRSGGSAANLRDRIGDMAKKAGGSDWTADGDTWRAIGAGIAKAGYNATERDAFLMNLEPNAAQHKWIFKGYGSYKP